MSFLKKTAGAWLVGLVIVTPALHVDAYSGFGTKQSEKKEELATGVSLIQERYAKDKVHRAVQVLDVAYRNSAVDLELYHLTPLGTLKPTTQHASLNTYEGHYVVGAMNASFYDFSSGFPVNMLVKNNEIIRYGILSPDANGPVNAPFAFGKNRNGALTITDFEPTLRMTHNGKTISLSSVNGERQLREAVLYTSAHAKETTGASPYVTDIVVTETSKSAKAFSFGDRITGKVSEIRRLGEGANATIPEDGFVISANGGPLSEELAGVSVGDEIEVEAQINDAWKDAEFMMATGPTLLKNGQVSISMNDNASFATGRQPRSAVGVSSDGTKLYFVTIDGRQDGYSNGATMRELAEYMRSIGAYNAINLDGGGSTTMAARLPYAEQATVVNRPSDQRERSVPTTLQVISTEAPKKENAPGEFSDVPSGHWARQSIINLSDRKIINGYNDGRFGPADPISREQTAIMIARALGLSAEGHKPSFKDVAADGFYHDAIAAVDKAGIMNGKTANTFNPKDTLTRAEMALILQRAYDIKGKSSNPFPDVNKSHWAYEAIDAMKANNIATGQPNGGYGPALPTTRAEFSVFLDRVNR